ncbi:hypothetical protein TVAG_152700 [Trichomonas vaginalis G3]|uniref:NTF2 domain-containing protein n=1 Tax=Trichomonas vaginalis (strain ATCC PRA-98 / G3) TaxID=412133 RepID=A2FWL8_TRIV3|nr:NTF2-like family [Trichomonas vaginalis G3]EAX90703.1 hypothetical protein TVAG_152700 [Trichomonas vaginalis G3]KAI5493036.1 NTF2-like family [Trichomonas vaginalis G3]|eukprot:XP_001303633.1 hypothetical protein [Trichomonas vaginalis G3]
MTSRESFGISKVLIDKFLPLMSVNPAEAMRYFAIDAKMIFSNSKENDFPTINGKHAIYDFLQTFPLFKTEVASYDTHTIPGEPTYTVTVISGLIYFGAKTSLRMFMSFHVEQRDNDRTALIRAMTFKIFDD